MALPALCLLAGGSPALKPGVHACACVCMHVHVCLFAQPCLFCDPMDCGLPGSSVHGILQARILEWAAIPFSRDLADPRIRFFTAEPSGKPGEVREPG